jgi:hypothetical protein
MRLAFFLIRFYPSAWRTRYAHEMRALLEDTPANFRTYIDLLKGALKMQLSVRSFPRLALLLSLAGLVLGFAGSYLITPQYVSSAVMRYVDDPAAPPFTPEQQSRIFQREEQEILSKTSISWIIQDPRLDLYKRERARAQLEDIIATMLRRDLRVAVIRDANATAPGDIAFSIQYTGPNAHKAQMVVQTLITRFRKTRLLAARLTAQRIGPGQNTEIEHLRNRVTFLEMKLGIPPEAPAATNLTLHSNPLVEVLDPPNLPELPAKPNRAVVALFGFIAGLIAAVLITLVRFTRRPAPSPVAIA